MKLWLKLLLSALVIAVAAGAVAALAFYGRINDPATLFAAPTPQLTPVQTASVAPAAPAATAAPTPTPVPTPGVEEYLSQWTDADFMHARANILLLGIDESAERESWGSYRTDTMMLVTVDFDTNEVTMISIPRDCYVKIYNAQGELDDPERPMEKINEAFSRGGGAKKKGFAYACTTVSKLMDVPVQYYVCVNMPLVKDVVNAMGGVEYALDVDFVMNGRAYQKGLQHMDGQAVLDYCRLRKDSSDLVRVDRQQRMIARVFETMRQTDQLRNIPAIYRSVQANIQTDLSFEQIASLTLLGSRMDMAQLHAHTVPASGVTINERSCLGVQTEKLARLIKEVFHRRTVNIDPEIDGEHLKTMQNPAAMQPGSYSYYQQGDSFFVLYPGAEAYVEMTMEDFYASFGAPAA
ncbi:MAG: LCP family protein [Clostridia bacterium]|nr:LCP family protein [Clostridia bacterium]